MSLTVLTNSGLNADTYISGFTLTSLMLIKKNHSSSPSAASFNIAKLMLFKIAREVLFCDCCFMGTVIPLYYSGYILIILLFHLASVLWLYERAAVIFLAW